MAFRPNPKDSMKSTWWEGDRTDWGLVHRLIQAFDVYPEVSGKTGPVHSKEEQVPYGLEWRLHIWILIHSLVPIAMHYAYVRITGHSFHPVATWFFYSGVLLLSNIREIHQIRNLSLVYGHFDGDSHARDGIPDSGVEKAILSGVSTTIFRIGMVVFCSYRASQSPASLNWAWLPAEIGLYSCTVDFWFYWYHRLMHEVDFLWKFHCTHHLTKHPNSLLSAFADSEQEMLDTFAVPLLAYLTLKLVGFPMGFYEWWICVNYVMFSEIFGHSGLRIAITAPSTLSWLLRLLDAELTVEDHDIHHRKGWKKSSNYGKQTRLWDRIFGTCADRIESLKSNIDYSNLARFPLC